MSLNVINTGTEFWGRVLVEQTSTSLETHDFNRPPRLKHLMLQPFQTSETSILSTFKDSLQTLHLEYVQLPPFQPTTFNQLTHPYLSYAPSPNLVSIQSLIASMPVLRFFAWDDHNNLQPLLPLLIPFLPLSITLIHARSWSSGLPSILEGASSHFKPLQYSLRSTHEGSLSGLGKRWLGE